MSHCDKLDAASFEGIFSECVDNVALKVAFEAKPGYYPYPYQVKKNNAITSGKNSPPEQRQT